MFVLNNTILFNFYYIAFKIFQKYLSETVMLTPLTVFDLNEVGHEVSVT